MKGEYSNSHDVFAKLHQQQQQQFHHHQLVTRECHTSEEEESRSSGGAGATRSKQFKTSDGNFTGADGATIEVVRRPRGRPPGSKNKPKPPLIITRDTDYAMHPQVLEVPGGLDVIDAIARFSRRRNVGLSILTGSGSVANVTLRQPTTNPGGTVTFHGRFNILSISATFLPPSSSSLPSPSNGFSISLAGPQGQIFGGSVVGSLLAADTVIVIVASFTNPSYHRLPIEEEEPNPVSDSADRSPPPVSGEGSHPLAENCGLSIYNCHLPSDVIWTPTARPPPPF